MTNRSDRVTHDLRTGDVGTIPPWVGPPDLTWIADNFRRVDTACQESVRWYLSKKNTKRRWGGWLRTAVVCSAALAGAWPTLAMLYEGVPAGATTLFAALGALFLALDRFGDFTGGWVRYIRTAQELELLQIEMRHRWLELHLTITHGPDADAQTKIAFDALALGREYADRTKRLIRDETERWATAFGQMLEHARQELIRHDRRGP